MNPSTGHWPQNPVSVEALRDPAEKTSGIVLWVFAVPAILVLIYFCVTSLGMFPLMVFLGGRMGQLFLLAHFKINGVQVSERQFPVLNEAVENFSSRLGIQRPVVFVVQQTLFNAFAARLASRNIVVLYSGAIDSILRSGTERDLSFILGHELGHIAAGHLIWRHRIQQLGSWFFWVGLWHRRRMELTCDAIGLELVGDTDTAMRAMSHMMVGSHLAAKLDAAAAMQQLREYESEFFVRYQVFYSTYPSLLSRLENLHKRGTASQLRFEPTSVIPPVLTAS